jgi:hypothetical protein
MSDAEFDDSLGDLRQGDAQLKMLAVIVRPNKRFMGSS